MKLLKEGIETCAQRAIKKKNMHISCAILAQMNTNNLMIFVDVVRQGSFSQVARHRQVTPSSISRSIQALENELGVRLFQRNTRHLSLTEAGSVYFERIETIVEDLNNAQQAIIDTSEQIQGNVRITAPPSFGTNFIAPRLSQLRIKYPELNIELLLSDQKLDLLAQHIDLAIRQGHLNDSNLIAERFITSQYRVCASPEYIKENGCPKTPEQLKLHQCLLFPFSGFECSWHFRRQKNDVAIQEKESITSIEINSPLIINNGLALRQCAIDGTGIVLLSNWLVDDEIANGRLLNIFPNFQVSATNFTSKISFVYPSRSYVPEKVRAVINFLRESI